jgi:hypothetical protein
MAPRIALLLIFWLLATGLCVAYVAITTGPGPLAFSSRQDDLQRLRDRPLRSWGPYLPRRVPSGKVPESTVALAPPLLEQPTTKSIQQPKQRAHVPRAEGKVPYSPEHNPAAQVESPASTEPALLGADGVESPLKRSAAPAAKSKPTAKLSEKRKKMAERSARKSRISQRKGSRGLGLFALSGDFGRPRGY